MNLSEILNHLGEDRSQYFNAVSPPIIQSSNFVFDRLEDFRAALSDELQSTIYTRGNNPTVAILRKKIAALEHAEDALIFGSGVGAIAAAVIAHVKTGDHIVCVEAPYSWTHKLLTSFLAPLGITHSFVDGSDIGQIEAAIQDNTVLLFLESPNSVTFEIQDLKACAALAKKHNLITIIDNSYASPIFQNPINFGIDIVVHSGTKYINGHSDVVVGVLAASKAVVKMVFESVYMTLGGIVSPNDAALVIRGLRTLEMRMKKSNESVQKIIAYLDQHPKVAEILFPFHPSHPQYVLATQQMSGTGGLSSVILNVDEIEKVEDFFHRLKRFLLAVSWGGHESLVLPFCAFHNVPGKEAEATANWRLVRFYIGWEDPDWLIEDLDQAMKAL